MGTLSNRRLSQYRPSNDKKIESVDIVSMGSNIASTSAADNYASSIVNFVPGRGNEWVKRPGTKIIESVNLEDYGVVRPDHSVMLTEFGSVKVYYLYDGYIFNGKGEKQDWYSYEEIYNFNYQDIHLEDTATQTGDYNRNNAKSDRYDKTLLNGKSNFNVIQTSDFIIWTIGEKMLYMPVNATWVGIQKIDNEGRVYFEPSVNSTSGNVSTKNVNTSMGKVWLEVPSQVQDIYSYSNRFLVNYKAQRPGHRVETFIPLNNTEEYMSPATDGIGLKDSLLYEGYINLDDTIRNDIVPFEWHNTKLAMGSGYVPWGDFDNDVKSTLTDRQKQMFDEFNKKGNTKSLKTLSFKYGVDSDTLDKIRNFANRTLDYGIFKQSPHFKTVISDYGQDEDGNIDPNYNIGLKVTSYDLDELNMNISTTNPTYTKLNVQDFEDNNIKTQDELIQYMEKNNIETISGESDIDISLLKYNFNSYTEADAGIILDKEIKGVSTIPYFGQVVIHYEDNNSVTLQDNSIQKKLDVVNVTSSDLNVNKSPTWDWTYVTNDLQHGEFKEGKLIGTMVANGDGNVGLYSFNNKGEHLYETSSVWRDNFYASSDYQYSSKTVKVVKNDNFIIATTDNNELIVYDNNTFIDREVVSTLAKETIRTYGTIDLDRLGLWYHDSIIIDRNDNIILGATNKIINISNLKQNLTFNIYDGITEDKGTYVSLYEGQLWNNIIDDIKYGIEIKEITGQYSNSIKEFKLTNNDNIIIGNNEGNVYKINIQDLTSNIIYDSSEILPSFDIDGDIINLIRQRLDYIKNVSIDLNGDVIINETRNPILYKHSSLEHAKYLDDFYINVNNKFIALSKSKNQPFGINKCNGYTYINYENNNQNINIKLHALGIEADLINKYERLDIKVTSDNVSTGSINTSKDSSISVDSISMEDTNLMHDITKFYNDKKGKKLYANYPSNYVNGKIRYYGYGVTRNFFSSGEYDKKRTSTQIGSGTNYEEPGNDTPGWIGGWLWGGIINNKFGFGGFGYDDRNHTYNYDYDRKNSSNLSIFNTHIMKQSNENRIESFTNAEDAYIDIYETSKSMFNSIKSKFIEEINNKNTTQIDVNFNAVIQYYKGDIGLDIIGMSTKKYDNIKGNSHGIDNNIYEGIGDVVNVITNTIDELSYRNGGKQDTTSNTYNNFSKYPKMGYIPSKLWYLQNMEYGQDPAHPDRNDWYIDKNKVNNIRNKTRKDTDNKDYWNTNHFSVINSNTIAPTSNFSDIGTIKAIVVELSSFKARLTIKDALTNMIIFDSGLKQGDVSNGSDIIKFDEFKTYLLELKREGALNLDLDNLVANIEIQHEKSDGTIEILNAINDTYIDTVIYNVLNKLSKGDKEYGELDLLDPNNTYEIDINILGKNEESTLIGISWVYLQRLEDAAKADIALNVSGDDVSILGIASQFVNNKKQNIIDEPVDKPIFRIFPSVQAGIIGDPNGSSPEGNGSGTFNSVNGVVSFQAIFNSSAFNSSAYEVFNDFFNITQLAEDDPFKIRTGESVYAKGWERGLIYDKYISSQPGDNVLIFNITIPMNSDIFVKSDDSKLPEGWTEGSLWIKQESLSSITSYMQSKIVSFSKDTLPQDFDLSMNRQGEIVSISTFDDKIVVAYENEVFVSEGTDPSKFIYRIENIPEHLGKIIKVLPFQGSIMIFFERGYTTFSPELTSSNSLQFKTPYNTKESPDIINGKSIVASASYIYMLTAKGLSRIWSFNNTITQIPQLTESILSSSINNKLINDIIKSYEIKIFTLEDRVYINMILPEYTYNYEDKDSSDNVINRLYIYDENKDLILSSLSSKWYTWEGSPFNIQDMTTIKSLDGNINTFILRADRPELLQLNYKYNINNEGDRNVKVDGFIDRAVLVDTINGNDLYKGEQIISVLETNPIGSENVYDMKWKSYALGLNNYGFNQEYFRKHFVLDPETGQFVDQNVEKNVYNVAYVEGKDGEIEVIHDKDRELDIHKVGTVNTLNTKAEFDESLLFTNITDIDEIHLIDKVSLGSAKASQFKIKIVHKDDKKFAFKDITFILKLKKAKEL